MACLADAGPAAIAERIQELDREWSSGRMVKAFLSGTILTGTALALIVSPWWSILPAAAGLFLLQSLFARTSFLSKVFHESGYRTHAEIEHEKFALKTLRGDFRHVPTIHDMEAQEDITRFEGEGGIVLEPEITKLDPRDGVREVIHATAQ